MKKVATNSNFPENDNSEPNSAAKRVATYGNFSVDNGEVSSEHDDPKPIKVDTCSTKSEPDVFSGKVDTCSTNLQEPSFYIPESVNSLT